MTPEEALQMRILFQKKQGCLQFQEVVMLKPNLSMNIENKEEEDKARRLHL